MTVASVFGSMSASVVAVVGALAAAAIVGVGFLQPRTSATLSMGVAPWAVFAGLLHGLSRADAYSDRWIDLLGFPGIVPTAIALVAGVWLLGALLAGRERPGSVGSLLATTGYGALLPPLLLAVAIMAASESAAIVGPVGVAVAAAALAGLAIVVLTSAYPDAITVLGAGTALLVFGHVLDALAGTVLLDPSTAPLPGYELAAGLGDPTASMSAYVGGRLVLALVVVVAATEWTRRHETGHVVAAVVGGAGLAAGVTTLTIVVTGLA